MADAGAGAAVGPRACETNHDAGDEHGRADAWLAGVVDQLPEFGAEWEGPVVQAVYGPCLQSMCKNSVIVQKQDAGPVLLLLELPCIHLSTVVLICRPTE